MEKTCTKCNIKKHIDCFYINKKKNNMKGVYFAICKICFNIKSKEYNKNNPIIIKNIRKKYNNIHRDEINDKSKIHYAENKEYYNNWRKTKYTNDINFKLRVLLRGRISDSLKRKKITKRNSSLILLGCSVEEYKKYLENQFKPEMNWENYGKIWEIDHIKPCDSFNLLNIEQQKQCFHYTNTQPLFKTTKIAKSFGYKNEIGNKNKFNKV